MKAFLLILPLLALYNNSIAEEIKLPAYKIGKYESTTIFTYYGAPPFTDGSINFKSPLNANFITGIRFKMIVDSTTNKGSAPAFSGFKDSLAVGYLYAKEIIKHTCQV